ncbi:uncharacterized protein BO96DRAFT_430193 [Aspergillus niger CBS 101883]|uniref:uncharacterized protein n=1 Tax=Aspergillus lacticoffeatus (strain CBS 101883) TaxID=1450533 RepID=UPI000D7F2257|nr:uncharacterized protein BO96DRAFT_430193 [Aspergillus niger CBS 101883]PYH61618.1 hypothetical protein BO96DRAFT_430193 [Aspergillus niger CBS 101883]
MSGKAEHLMRGERQSGRERSSEETTCDGGQTVDQDPQHGDPSVAISFVYCLECLQEPLPSHPCLLWGTDGLAVLDGRFICSALNVRAGAHRREDLAHFSPDCQGEGFSGLPFLLPSVTQPWHARRGISRSISQQSGERSDDSKGGRQTGQTDRNAGRTRAPRLVPQGNLACGVTARASGHLRTCPTPADET